MRRQDSENQTFGSQRQLGGATSVRKQEARPGGCPRTRDGCPGARAAAAAAAAAAAGGGGRRGRAVERPGEQPAPAEHRPGPLRRLPGVAGAPAAVSAAGGRELRAERGK